MRDTRFIQPAGSTEQPLSAEQDRLDNAQYRLYDSKEIAHEMLERELMTVAQQYFGDVVPDHVQTAKKRARGTGVQAIQAKFEEHYKQCSDMSDSDLQTARQDLEAQARVGVDEFQSWCEQHEPEKDELSGAE